MEHLWEVLRFVRYHPEVTIIGAFTLIQVAPIKINPWSWIAGLVHKFLFGTIDKKLDAISAKVDRLEAQSEEDKAIQARTQILRFADELYAKKEHQLEYFQQMLDTILVYEKYCEKHPDFTNGRTLKSCEIIKTTYDKIWGQHRFYGGDGHGNT